MNDPLKILVKRDELSLDNISQFYIDVELEEFKFDTLIDLYESISISQAVIFCNSRKKAEWLSETLRHMHFSASTLHGGMSQRERDRITSEFRNCRSRIMITTDIWARGIDISMISLVINFDLPVRHESYLHRIGRTGRFGRSGVALSLVTKADQCILRDIETNYAIIIYEMPSSFE